MRKQKECAQKKLLDTPIVAIEEIYLLGCKTM